MIVDEIRAELFRLRDEPYRQLQITTIPSVAPERIIGVRTPALRAMVRELAKREDAPVFLAALPHRYFEENQLHAFILSGIRDYAACIDALDRFLPWIDNWATCDQMSPKILARHRAELIGPIRRWLASDHPYTVRFTIGMLMTHYLDDDFSPAYPALAAAVRSEDYYVRMMVAWYFATALAKRYDEILPYIEARRLEPWTHNKAIQKALESDRVPPERKEALRQYKWKRRP